MFTPSKLTLISGCLFTACVQASMTIESDPENPSGYLVSRAELHAAEQSKTADPMYAIWAQALQTRTNQEVEAIEPGLTSNPVNVQRVERVFPQ
ncbi:carbohydrate-binding protein, partial [Vibrio furnissii]|nr:carbohydrate-binding protein [Vibrio furnissii]